MRDFILTAFVATVAVFFTFVVPAYFIITTYTGV